MQHISYFSGRDALRVWGYTAAKSSAQSHKERRKSMISIPRLSLQGLHLSAGALLVYAALHCSHFSSDEHAQHSPSAWGGLSLCLSLPNPYSLSVRVSIGATLCHCHWLVMLLHASLGPGPSVGQGEGDIWWAKWTEVSGLFHTIKIVTLSFRASGGCVIRGFIHNVRIVMSWEVIGNHSKVPIEKRDGKLANFRSIKAMMETWVNSGAARNGLKFDTELTIFPLDWISKQLVIAMKR